jgi:hypothetical protein
MLQQQTQQVMLVPVADAAAEVTSVASFVNKQQVAGADGAAAAYYNHGDLMA